MLSRFQASGVTYPPEAVVLVGLKAERELQVYAGPSRSALRHVHTYPVLASSGGLGPKLREGDRQVPEGLYRIESLNPNSRFHLSLRVDYPNGHDRARAEEESRTGLGGDIMIHGSAVSVGCLAVGDVAAEDLFILAAETGRENLRVILSPVDFRSADLPARYRPSRPWVTELYTEIRSGLETLPNPGR
jgi:murein L,D-transpeptidase YafK